MMLARSWTMTKEGDEKACSNIAHRAPPSWRPARVSGYGMGLRRLLQLGLFLTAVITQLPTETSAIEWLSAGFATNTHWNRTADCSKTNARGFIKQQIQICKRNMELMPVVAHAARETAEVCQALFSAYRWNCSSIRSAPNFLPDLIGGSREQAFVHALSSAALTQAIAKACSVGATTKCSCGRIPNEAPPDDFKWGGCGDDVRFGLIFSASFGDSGSTKRQKKSKRALMNLHNNKLGRTLTADSLTTDCKCHGVSGSCSIKTCWKALPDLRVIGMDLQRLYSVAVEVANKKNKRTKTRKFVPVMRNRPEVTEGDLIYYTNSPDYCLPDAGLGSLGTRHRRCDRDSTTSAGCQSMCCGRGFTSRTVQVKHRCECKYYWCCYVKCNTCLKTVEINRCR